MHASVPVLGGLYLTPPVVCAFMLTSSCRCPLVLSGALMPPPPLVSAPSLLLCGYLLPTLCISVLSLSLPPPQPVCVFPCSVPPPHPLHSASLEENIQTLQHQHPKFILQHLWPGGRAKEKSGRRGRRRESRRVAGTGWGGGGSEQDWSHAPGRRAVMGLGWGRLEQKLIENSWGKNPSYTPGIPRV